MTIDPIPIIDTHQHLWDLDRVRLAWLNPEGKEGAVGLDRSFLMEDYLDSVREQNVAASIYVEDNVIQEDQVAEVECALDHCRSSSNPMQAAVIGGFPQDPGFPVISAGMLKTISLRVSARSYTIQTDRRECA